MKQHDRKFAISGIGLVKFRPNRFHRQAKQNAREHVEDLICSARYFDSVSFSWIALSLNFGIENEYEPEYERIDKKYEALPLSIEIDIRGLRYVSLERLTRVYTIAALRAVVHAGMKYGLPTQELQAELQRLIEEEENCPPEDPPPFTDNSVEVPENYKLGY